MRTPDRAPLTNFFPELFRFLLWLRRQGHSTDTLVWKRCAGRSCFRNRVWRSKTTGHTSRISRNRIRCIAFQTQRRVALRVGAGKQLPRQHWSDQRLGLVDRSEYSDHRRDGAGAVRRAACRIRRGNALEAEKSSIMITRSLPAGFVGPPLAFARRR